MKEKNLFYTRCIEITGVKFKIYSLVIFANTITKTIFKLFNNNMIFKLAF